MSFLGFSALVTLAAFAGAPLPEHLQAVEAVGVAQLSQSGDWRVRQQAAAITAWNDDPDAAELAWDLAPRVTRAGFPRFHDPALRDSGVAPIILERLRTQGEDEAVRMALVELLPRVGGDWSALLAEAYADEHQPGVRMMMVETARRADDPDAAQALLALGAADRAPTARAAAMRTAPHIDGAASLVRAGLSDADAMVRADAARAAGWLEDDAAITELRALLRDGDGEVRLRALRAIERIDADALRGDPIVADLAQDADPRVARAAASLRD